MISMKARVNLGEIFLLVRDEGTEARVFFENFN